MDRCKTRFIRIWVIFVVLMTPQVLAAQNISDLINKAGMQRMLSQKIAKCYFYVGKGIRVKTIRAQLNQAIDIFRKNHAELKAKIQDSAVQDVLSFVDFSFQEFDDLVTKPYSQKNAALVLDLSETLLETSHDVVLKLEKLSRKKKDRIVNISGKQRMLAQRIAKFYIAYQAGFKDSNSVYQLEEAVKEFESNLAILRADKRNTDRINFLLNKIENQWKVVKGFFLDIRSGGIPMMVFVSTDNITKIADEITRLYVEITDRNQ